MTVAAMSLILAKSATHNVICNARDHSPTVMINYSSYSRRHSVLFTVGAIL